MRWLQFFPTQFALSLTNKGCHLKIYSFRQSLSLSTQIFLGWLCTTQESSNSTIRIVLLWTCSLRDSIAKVSLLIQQSTNQLTPYLFEAATSKINETRTLIAHALEANSLFTYSTKSSDPRPQSLSHQTTSLLTCKYP